MKKRVISFILCAVMLLGLCSCACVDMSCKLNPDGSGTITGYSGITTEMWNELVNSGMTVDAGNQYFTKYGTTYIGEIETIDFANVDELNDYLDGAVVVTKGNNSFTAVIHYDGDPMEDIGSFGDPSSLGMTEEEVAELMKDMVFEISLEFPWAPTVVGGPTEAVTVYQNRVTIDVLKLDMDTITIYAGAGGRFTDVDANAWYYDAVEAMANGGLVAGYGDGRFGPNDRLSYAALAQILYNVVVSGRTENGDYICADGKIYDAYNNPGDTGFWAYQPIDFCISAGYMENLGTIDWTIWNASVTREAAVAAMTRAYEKVMHNYGVSYGVVIPDVDSIDNSFKQDILHAYNLGLVAGVDGSGRFSPKSELTRGQLCQLFYRMDWTQPINTVGVN